MRALVVSSILALAVVVAGCATIDTVLTRKVQIGEATFVVLQYGEIAPVSLGDDEFDKITSQHVYQVTADGRYRHLGSYYPLTAENLFSTNTAGTGVYSEADRPLVNEVLKKVSQDRNNFITRGNENVDDIKTAVEVITGEEPVKVDSHGELRFPASKSPNNQNLGTLTEKNATDFGNTIDDSQGE